MNPTSNCCGAKIYGAEPGIQICFQCCNPCVPKPEARTEKKKIEKLEQYFIYDGKHRTEKKFTRAEEKINEIIDYLNEQ